MKRRKCSVRKAWGGVLLWGVKEEESRQVWPALLFHAEGPPAQHPSQRAEQWFGAGAGRVSQGLESQWKGESRLGEAVRSMGRGQGGNWRGGGRTERD